MNKDAAETFRTALPCFVRYSPSVLKPGEDTSHDTRCIAILGDKGLQMPEGNSIQENLIAEHQANVDTTVA